MSYPPWLLSLLTSHTLVPPGSQAELSIRATSILAVEAVRDEITRLGQAKELNTATSTQCHKEFTSVIIDFFLWDLGELRRFQTDVILMSHLL